MYPDRDLNLCKVICLPSANDNRVKSKANFETITITNYSINARCLLIISHPSSANNYFIKFSASQNCSVSSLNLLYSNFSHGAYLPSHIHQARMTTSLNFRFPVLLFELVKFVVLKFFKCKRPEVYSTSDLQICTKCSNLESKKRSNNTSQTR